MSTHLLEPRTLKELAELLNRLTYDECNYRAKKAVGNLPELIRLILVSPCVYRTLPSAEHSGVPHPVLQSAAS